MKGNTLAIALASLLVGGVAVGAYHNSRDAVSPASESIVAAAADTGAVVDAGTGEPVADVRDTLDYADVVAVAPVTQRETLYATVLGTDPVRETMTTTSPREVCEDVVVQERLPERDGNVGGTVVGAVVGGLIGNQIGGGNGRKVATAAGAATGGYIGNRVDRNHVGGRVVERVDRQCRTVQDSSQSSRVVAYNVTYRNPDGTTGTLRTDSKPGNRIELGDEQRTVGYDVTYRYEGTERTIRMDEDPGERLPVINGRIMTAAVDETAERG
ncbi:glycine zipper 2TM domain-containing protein [Luteimonas sp. BDR2-5]|uniref:glycine zipper 2TM domain-containing protein n=1 Tax=Proluteimonas luteida TaxID=2878685 RepID=UPI001E4FABE7|nr:glycine zipper 2TM domain-containing protein [Luteimonas sp. BDR2-5]MCD9028606.1 glycine zipper 2TM domain-containing protein [Luteimonas sp. BDR2-5]